MNHIVIGANGSIGRALVEALAQRQLPTLAISRSTRKRALPGVSYAQADIVQPGILAQLIPENSIVYYAVNAPYHRWKTDLQPLLEASINACCGRGIKFVYIDNLYAYGGEETHLQENLGYRAQTQKGILRAQLAHRIMQEHKAGNMKVTIARASDIFGPGVKMATLGDYVVKNLIKNHRASVPVSVTTPHCFNFVNDLAHNLVTLAQSDLAWGQVWHMPADAPISIQDWGKLFLSELTKNGQAQAGESGITSMSPLSKKILGLFVPPLREYDEMQYEYERIYELDAGKFCRTFAAVVTPQRDAIQQTIAWYQGAGAPAEVTAIGKKTAAIKTPADA